MVFGSEFNRVLSGKPDHDGHPFGGAHPSGFIPETHQAHILMCALLGCCCLWGQHDRDDYLSAQKSFCVYMGVGVKGSRSLGCSTYDSR